MARVLLPLLVLLLALSPGGAPSPTMAQDCPAAGKVVGETDTQVIKNTAKYSWRYRTLTVYVKRRPGFKGVGLKVQGSDSRHYDAWFPAEPECFGNIDKWHQLRLEAWINSTTNTLHFGLRTGTCWRRCITNSHPQSSWRFSVVAHGRSEWFLYQPPRSCDTIALTQLPYPSTLPNCKNPPPPAPPTNGNDKDKNPPPPAPPTSKDTPLAVSVVIPVVVVVVFLVVQAAAVAVMLIRRRRQRQQLATPNEVRLQSRPADQTQQVQFQSRPADQTQEGQFRPMVVDVLHEIEGEIYLQMVTQLPRLSESHFYDSVNFNNIAALDRGRSPQVTESGGHANEALYDDVAGQGEHRRTPPGTDEPVYENVAGPDEHRGAPPGTHEPVYENVAGRGAPQSPEEPIYLAVL